MTLNKKNYTIRVKQMKTLWYTVYGFRFIDIEIVINEKVHFYRKVLFSSIKSSVKYTHEKESVR